MARHIWTVLCTHGLVDSESKQVTLLECIERMTIRDQDAIEQLATARASKKKGLRFPVRMELVSWWVRSDYSKPETSAARVVLESPKGAVLVSHVMPLNLSQSIGFRTTARFEDFPLTDFGLHWLVIKGERRTKRATSWREVARYPLEVIAANAPTSPAPPSSPPPTAPS
jgi:hypothetical protein